MAKSSNTHGYIGASPTQLVTNTGVHSVGDALELSSIGHWGGSLELIEEKTVSGVSTIDFIDLKNYDVHLLSINGLNSSTTNQFYIRLSTDSGSNFISSGYQYSFYRGTTAGSFIDSNSASSSQINTGVISSTTVNRGNAYIYFYNLLNSSKYSYCTFQSYSSAGADQRFTFGGGVLPTSATHNAFQIQASTGTTSGNIKLYGVKQI